jgi:hypothetical protein
MPTAHCDTSEFLMTNLGSRSLCFFVERLRVEPPPDDERRLPEIIEVERVVSLRVRHYLVTAVAGVWPDALVFEPLPGRPVPTIRMTVDDDDAVVRVNGRLVGSTCELHVRDMVECVGDPVVLHLSMVERPYVGPPTTEHAGQACAVCRGPIEGRQPPDGKSAAEPPAALVLECLSCGAVLHEHAPQSDSVGEVLECAKSVEQCPVCETTLRREEAYVYIPEMAG